MTYDTAERSNYDGITTSLYEFKLGTAVWRYASGNDDVVLNGDTYSAIAIEDDGITQSGETTGDDFMIKIDASADFNDLFVGTPPSEPIFVVMRRKNFGEPDAPVHWAGTLKSNTRKTVTHCEILCRPLTSSLNRNGLRLSWGRGCPHALYDRNCRVDPTEFGVTSSVSAVSGASLSVSGLGAYDDGYFTGGYLEFVYTNGATERLAIERHVDAQLDILGTVDRLSVNQMVTVYPGCDRISATCEQKFDNLRNYGGFPHLPTKSPFDGDPVF